MRFVIAAALLLSPVAPAFADDVLLASQVAQSVQASDLRRNQMLRDANGIKLGAIDVISADGTVGVIVGTRYVRVPVSTITVVNGNAMTSLAKKDLKTR